MSNTHTTKPAAILQLEKELGIELKEVANRDIIEKCTYVFNQNDEIIELYLDSSNITNIEGLEELNSLIYLDLANNKISDTEPLKWLKNLEHLDLAFNQIKSIYYLNNLKHLKYLNLNNNLFIYFDAVKELTNLSHLDLSGNKIHSINNLSCLENLTDLDLSYNQLWGYQIEIFNSLNNLTDLDLGHNEIEDISNLKQLNKLTNLKLNNNQISEISLNFLNQFPNLKYLYLYKNPIQNIPKEIFDQFGGNVLNEVRYYLEDIEKGQCKIYQAKVILIGNGLVGKTCLVKRWLDNTFDPEEKSTHAIQLRRHFLKKLEKEKGFDKIQLQIWDFGGQDIYHATHRLFMQTHALFILVWDQQTENALSQTEKLNDNLEITYQNYPLHYWLDYAKNLGKNSPILIVQTKKDQDKKREIKDWDFLKENYNIIDTISVEASKDKRNGFDQFKSCLEEQIEEMLKETCTALPTSWWKVQLDIQALQSKSTKNITVDKFQKICQKYDLDQHHAKTLLQYLHDTGLLFYKKHLFQNQIILDQKWAIEAVYILFDRKGLFPDLVQKGIFNAKKLKYAWQHFSQDEQELCLDFMKSCEICFEIDYKYKKPFEERRFLAPALLPKDKPIELNDVWERLKQLKGMLFIRYEYRFLHYGNIQSFIVRTNEWSDRASLWKNGCQLKNEEGNLALIEGHFYQQKQYLEIQITGKNPQQLLDKIRNELEKIQYYDKDNIIELWSIDGVSFVEREKVEQHPKENLKIQTIDGNWLNYTDFALFLNKNPEEIFMSDNNTDQAKIVQRALSIAIEKLGEIEKGLILETDVARKFDLKYKRDDLKKEIKEHEKELAQLNGRSSSKSTSRREPAKKPETQIHLHINDSNLTGNVLNLGTISGQVQNSIQQLPATNPEQTQLKEILNKLQQWVEKLPEPTIKSQDKADALQQVETIAKSASETTEQNKGILRTALKALKGFSAEVNETVSDSNKIINEVNELFKQIKAILMLE